MRKKVVFISHSAERSGAPILLLHLLRWLKKEDELDFIILLEQGGELEHEFHEIAETLLWNLPNSQDIWQYRWERITKKVQKHQRGVLNRVKGYAPTAIYGNTIVSVPLGIKLKELTGCPFICHVHELSVVIDEFFGEENFTKLARDADFFIAGSKAVAENLHRSHLIPLQKISEVYEFIPTQTLPDVSAIRQTLRTQLAIADDTFVVTGSGPLDWRKAPDLFIQVANHVHRATTRRIKFVWIGGKLKSVDGRRVKHDLSQSGAGSYIDFVGSKPNFDDYLCATDLFLLTSREDPFPLACIQAAALGKPLVCFADTGGMPEFVEQDCGIVVPYLRPDLMAEAVLKLCQNTDLYKECGANAKLKAQQRHTVDLAGPLITRLIEQVIAQA